MTRLFLSPTYGPTTQAHLVDSKCEGPTSQIRTHCQTCCNSELEACNLFTSPANDSPLCVISCIPSRATCQVRGELYARDNSLTVPLWLKSNWSVRISWHTLSSGSSASSLFLLFPRQWIWAVIWITENDCSNLSSFLLGCVEPQPLSNKSYSCPHPGCDSALTASLWLMAAGGSRFSGVSKTVRQNDYFFFLSIFCFCRVRVFIWLTKSI